MNGKTVAILAALTLAPLAADAQSYRCVGKDGKRHYAATIPVECYGKPVEQLNAQGMVVKRIDPEGSEKQRLAKEAADAKKRDEAAAAREVTRRNHALLATYSSDKDIEESRGRALVENTRVIEDLEARIEAIRKRQTQYEKEHELYKGKKEPSAKLRDDIKSAQEDLMAQQQVLQAKKREVDSINARYDDDKKRYAELTRKR